MAARLHYNRFGGLMGNPINLHVKMHVAGRDYLGDVKDCRRDDLTGTWFLAVYHFNGEPWPWPEVAASSVEVI